MSPRVKQSSTTPSPLERAVRSLADGETLSETLTTEAFGQVMRGEGAPTLVAALLFGLRVRGADPQEVAGAVRALRAAMVSVPVSDRTALVDTCGTGGGRTGTFNVSTAAALVAAGAGATVAKHGNRSYTSKCGSADVLEALGVSISLDAAQAAEALSTVGMVFLFAPAFHPAMRHVAPIRRELGVATIMNIVGPLANPAGVTRQLVGVADPALGPLVAQVFALLGAEHALVVHAAVAGMDEIAPVGKTLVWEVREGTVTEDTIDPIAHGVRPGRLEALAGGTPEENAQRVARLLEAPGRDPEGRDIVVLNAGAACYVAGLTADLATGIELARASLDEGRAAEILAQLRSPR